jgi:pimeloyl-ACP methyl ester carboxylesterase
LADELPNVQLVVIANADHVPHEERPEAFMQAVTGFLSTLAP